MTGQNNKELSLKKGIISATIVLIAIIIIPLIFYFFHFHSGFSEKQDTWGTFGDFFGGLVNPIIGGLSVIALVATLVMQQKQLKIQQEDSQKQQRQLDLQQKELKEQQKQQKLDSYERMVFWLIDGNQKILEEIYSTTYDYGKNNEKEAEDDLTPEKKTRTLLNGIYYNMRWKNELEDARKLLRKPLYNLINTYCRNLFNALKTMNNNYTTDDVSKDQQKSTNEIIEHNEHSSKEIKTYTSLLRSFIPEKMVYVIAVNITNPDPSYDSYRTLVKNYAMLEHISFDFLYNKANNKELLGIIKNQYTYPAEIKKLEEEIENLTIKVDPQYSNTNENVYLNKHKEMLTKLSEDNNLSDNPILNFFNRGFISINNETLSSFLNHIEKKFQINISDEFKTEYLSVWNRYLQWQNEQLNILGQIKTKRNKIESINEYINSTRQLKKDIEGSISHQLIIALGEDYFESNQIYKDIKDKFNAVGFEFPIYNNKEEINAIDSNMIQNKEQQP